VTNLIDLDALRRELTAAGTLERAVGAKAYLKSDLEFLGRPSRTCEEAPRSGCEKDRT